jgi:hypothetical protein
MARGPLTDDIRRGLAKLLRRRYRVESSNVVEYRTARKSLYNSLTEAAVAELEEEVEAHGRDAFIDKWLEPLNYEPVTAAEVLGSLLSQDLQFSEAARDSFNDVEQTDGISLVPNQSALDPELRNGRFLQSASNAGLLHRARPDLLHESVKLGKVLSSTHPTCQVQNAIQQTNKEVHAVFVDSNLAPHTVLGLLNGYVSLGREFESSLADTLQIDDIRCAISGTDLEGSLADNEGWIQIDDRSNYEKEKSEGILVLDSWRVRNELSYVADVRDDPLEQADVDVTTCTCRTVCAPSPLSSCPPTIPDMNGV